ncbi:MAG: ornithine cyclodeaminase family protein [Sphingomonadales bacterium]|nr:ornithine cyclodeaminase family protein [Sphingomonadales bacterium]
MSGSGNVSEHRTIFVNDDTVGDLADWASVVRALDAAYAGDVSDEMVPMRTMARGDGFWMRTLSAISPSGQTFGCKIIAASPRKKRASYLIPLWDQQTMDLVALIDGSRITGLRTAGTGAVAVGLLAPRRPLKVGILGSGFESRGLLAAVQVNSQVAEARVFSPTQANREKFAADFGIMAAASAEEAVDGADLVLCAARAYGEEPTLQGRWLAPHATVVSVGSTLPEQREVDAETLARAALIVADMPEEVLHETGDALAASAAGVDLAAKTVALGDLAGGRVARPEGIAIYKSVGSALQDIVIAEMILQRAQAASRFFEMPESIHTIIK